MSNTTKDAAAKDLNRDKPKSAQQQPVRVNPPLAKHIWLPPEELKYLRAEMRLG